MGQTRQSEVRWEWRRWVRKEETSSEWFGLGTLRWSGRRNVSELSCLFTCFCDLSVRFPRALFPSSPLVSLCSFLPLVCCLLVLVLVGPARRRRRRRHPPPPRARCRRLLLALSAALVCCLLRVGVCVRSSSSPFVDPSACGLPSFPCPVAQGTMDRRTREGRSTRTEGALERTHRGQCASSGRGVRPNLDGSLACTCR